MKASPLKQRDRDRLRGYLRILHERLTSDFRGLAEEVEVPGELRDAHQGDPGAQEWLEHVDITLLQSDDRVLQEITAALRRLDQAAFGVCEECRAPIARRRLEALPWARRCRSCQEERERWAEPEIGEEGAA